MPVQVRLPAVNGEPEIRRKVEKTLMFSLFFCNQAIRMLKTGILYCEITIVMKGHFVEGYFDEVPFHVFNLTS